MTAATIRNPVGFAIRVTPPLILKRQKRDQRGLLRDYRASLIKENRHASR